MRLTQDGRLYLASHASTRRAAPPRSAATRFSVLGIRGVHVGSTVSLSVKSCWQHASGDQRAPLLLPHEWLMFLHLLGFFFVCVSRMGQGFPPFIIPLGTLIVLSSASRKAVKLFRFFLKQLLDVMSNHKDLTDKNS